MEGWETFKRNKENSGELRNIQGVDKFSTWLWNFQGGLTNFFLGGGVSIFSQGVGIFLGGGWDLAWVFEVVSVGGGGSWEIFRGIEKFLWGWKIFGGGWLTNFMEGWETFKRNKENSGELRNIQGVDKFSTWLWNFQGGLTNYFFFGGGGSFHFFTRGWDFFGRGLRFSLSVWSCFSDG